MLRIALLSDTHNHLDAATERALEGADEIWHAGDFGSMEIADRLEAIALLRGVWGNIDGQALRQRFPEQALWRCEDVPVLMQHIGGYPKRYAPGIAAAIRESGAKIFISGHSHILKIIYDPALDCLHMNPGAAGRQGWHKVRTVVRFEIEGTDIKNCRVVEVNG